MEAVLDTSFIISCVRNKIDFIAQLQEQGFKVKVPKEVLDELKDVKKKPKTSHADRTAISVALDMLANRKVKKVTIRGKNVDEGLINRGKEGAYIATLDAGIKNKVPRKIVILRAKGRVSGHS